MTAGRISAAIGLALILADAAPPVAAQNCNIPKAFVEKCLRTPGYPGDSKFVICATDGRPLCCYQHRDGSQACSTDSEMKISGPQYPGPHMPLPAKPRPPAAPKTAPK